MNRLLISVVNLETYITSSKTVVSVSDDLDDEIRASLYNKRNADFLPQHETRMQCVGRTVSGGMLFEQYAIMTDKDFDKRAMMEIVKEWQALDTTQPLGEWFDCAMLEQFAQSVIPVPSMDTIEKIMSIFAEFEDFVGGDNEPIQ